MSWPPTAADLYKHGPASGYFSDLAAGVVDAAVSAALGELATFLSGRCGGDPEEWTWTTTAGQEQATRDVCLVAASEVAVNHGLVLPGEGADPAWLQRAQAVRNKWEAMGAPSGTRAALYAGLVDATSAVTEGSPGGWSDDTVQSWAAEEA